MIRRIRAFIATNGQRWVFPDDLDTAYRVAMAGIDVQDAELSEEERHLMEAYDHLRQVRHPVTQQMGLTLRALLDARAVSRPAAQHGPATAPVSTALDYTKY